MRLVSVEESRGAALAPDWEEDLRDELGVLALKLGLPGEARAPDVARTGRFTRLTRRLALAPVERALLAAVLSPDADARFRDAWDGRPTLGALRAVLGPDAVMPLLAEGHVLRSLELVRLVDPGGASPYDFDVVPGVALAGWLSSAVWDERAAGVERAAGRALLGDVLHDARDLARLVTGLRAGGAQPRRRTASSAPPRLLCIEGRPGSGRGHLAEALAAALGLELASATLDGDAARVPALLRAALLGQACPALVVRPEHTALLAPALRDIEAHYDGPLVVVCEERPPVPAPWSAVELPVRLPGTAARERLWRRALGPAAATVAVENAARVPLGHGAIFRAAAGAVASAQLSGEPLAARLLADAARGELARTSPLCERIRGRRNLDDLVAPPELRAQLAEILAFARHRRTAFDSWGLDRLGGEALGLKVLFYGPPGTGKTMSAQVLASELDVDLYRVDLSAVVSKWVGETEKHLKQVFDEADATGALLLFDEADALFAKRTTNVQSAMDRHSNLEVNYLLQRMESFDGICVLTTNHDKVLDDAFRRRLNFRVRFPAPDAGERATLWRRLVEAVPRREAIDFERVADGFALAGGNIKNAVTRAVVLAIDEGGALATRHLLEAAAREMLEIGRVVRD